MQPYISDLHIANYDDLLNKTVIEQAFKHIIMPLYEIASTNGFSADWTYLHKKKEKESGVEKLNFVSEVEDENKYNSYLPFYPIEVAAGNFTDSEVMETPSSWLDMTKTNYHGVQAQDLFITQITGHSMEPLIPNGSYCLFKYGVVGSRNNRVVLVKKDGIIDPDLQTLFTIKRYFSKKIPSSEDGWIHETIELRPDNKEYPILIVEPEDTEDVFVIAEFIQVITSELKDHIDH